MGRVNPNNPNNQTIKPKAAKLLGMEAASSETQAKARKLLLAKGEFRTEKRHYNISQRKTKHSNTIQVGIKKLKNANLKTNLFSIFSTKNKQESKEEWSLPEDRPKMM